MPPRHEPRQLFRKNLLDRFNDPDLRDFVQSTLNILSDGIDVDDVHGLKLEAKGTSRNLISFFDKIREQSPIWEMSFDADRSEGLKISESGEARFFLKKGGNIGIGTTDPKFKLEVDGVVGMHGRIGLFEQGNVPADGKWHTIIQNLGGCQGFEAMAHINHMNDQRFGLTYAILLMSDKKGARNSVQSVEAGSRWLWGRLFNKLKFRWSEDKASSAPDKLRYKLEIRSHSRFGMPGARVPMIYYRLTKIWDINYEFSGDAYRPTQVDRMSVRDRAQPRPPEHGGSQKIKIKR